MPAIYTIQLTKAEPHIAAMMKLVTTLALVPAKIFAAIAAEHSTPATCQVTLFKPTAATLTLRIAAILCAFLANYLIANLGTNIKRRPTYGA
jgi:hypothetical protein